MKVIGIVSHGSDIIALTGDGRLFHRFRDPKDFNQGPHSAEKYLWVPVEGPSEPVVAPPPASVVPPTKM